ncbi:MAG: hypothetical protein F6K40_11575 [Okeania sp. SIO3I5]|nr:hypothetical protein [Okeania sp. SIO3I5]NEQ36882.1 hypothetical protein [Okeania sp. SIO3I5]
MRDELVGSGEGIGSVGGVELLTRIMPRIYGLRGMTKPNNNLTIFRCRLG